MREVTAIEPKWLTEAAPNLFKTADPNAISKRKRQEKIAPLHDRHAASQECVASVAKCADVSQRLAYLQAAQALAHAGHVLIARSTPLVHIAVHLLVSPCTPRLCASLDSAYLPGVAVRLVRARGSVVIVWDERLERGDGSVPSRRTMRPERRRPRVPCRATSANDAHRLFASRPTGSVR